MTAAHLRATSEYIPDTVLHPLNGDYVVVIGGMRSWVRDRAPWLSPDEADAFADSLKRAAALARAFRGSDDTDERTDE